jgi:hypothetical protein
MPLPSPATPTQQPSLAQLLIGQEEPTLVQYGIQYGQAEQDIGLLNTDVTAQTALMQQGTGYSQALLGNQMAGNTVSQQMLGSQIQTAAGQQGVEQQQYGLQQGTGGVGGGGYAAQLANLQYQYPLQQQAQESQAAAQGSVNTVGQKEAMGTLAEQQQFNVGNLQNQQQQAALGQQSEQIGYGGQQAQFAGQGQQLALAAQALGINSQQLQNQLAQGLAGLGMSDVNQQNQLVNTATQALAGQGQSLGSILSLAGVTGGLPANWAQSLNGNLYLGGQ